MERHQEGLDPRTSPYHVAGLPSQIMPHATCHVATYMVNLQLWFKTFLLADFMAQKPHILYDIGKIHIYMQEVKKER